MKKAELNSKNAGKKIISVWKNPWNISASFCNKG